MLIKNTKSIIAFMLAGILLCASFCISQNAQAEDIGDLKGVKNFLELEQIFTNIKEMEEKNLNTYQLSVRPWTDTYWPDLLGSVAHPYNERGAPGYILGWLTGIGFMSGRPSYHDTYASWTPYQIDNLSPAEKYDLLIGDTEFTFSRAVGKMVIERKKTGITSTWTGICHGWSPASIAFERPKRAVTLTGRLGHKITFYPSDIKGLMSFLWAKSFAQNFTKVEGWQCPYKADRNTRMWSGRTIFETPEAGHNNVKLH
jgi:hypothetical protein